MNTTKVNENNFGSVFITHKLYIRRSLQINVKASAHICQHSVTGVLNSPVVCFNLVTADSSLQIE